MLFYVLTNYFEQKLNLRFGIVEIIDKLACSGSAGVRDAQVVGLVQEVEVCEVVVRGIGHKALKEKKGN
jgi:hypothetical protein